MASYQQREITLKARKRGCHLVSREVWALCSCMLSGGPPGYQVDAWKEPAWCLTVLTMQVMQQISSMLNSYSIGMCNIFCEPHKLLLLPTGSACKQHVYSYLLGFQCDMQDAALVTEVCHLQCNTPRLG